MINFKDPKDQTPSALAVLGMVLIGGAVIISLFFSGRGNAKAYSSKAKKDKDAFEKRKIQAQSDRSVYEFAIERYQWKEKEDVVTPTALEIISKRADESGLKLVSFRPLKSAEVSSMIQLPMQFTVDGSFANVAAMLESLEKEGSRLTVQQVQFASQEGETDNVSANVNLVAFLAKPEKLKDDSKTPPPARTSATQPKTSTSSSSEKTAETTPKTKTNHG